MVSFLRLSACYTYVERTWVIYCSLSWQWYIFKTSNLSERIDFIMFPVANEKQRLSVALITRRCNIRLQHVSAIIHFHWKFIKLVHTNVIYMLLNVSFNHSWRTLSKRRKASKEINNSKKSSFMLLTSLRPPIIHDSTLRLVTLTPEPMGLRSQWYITDKI